MATPAFVAQTEGTVALGAATVAKSILSVIAPANKALGAISEVGVSFDGVTASERPILVELMRSTQATAGTSSAVTPRQIRGAAVTISWTAAKNYTAEPTVLTPVREWLVDPYKGSLIEQFPLGREPETAIAGAIVLRMTIQSGGAAVNTRAYMEVESGV